MRRASELVGLPILTYDTGRQIGSVKEVLLSLPKQRIVAFLVSDQGWSDDATFVPFEAVVSLGPCSVTVAGEDVVVKASDRPDIMEAMKSRKDILGTKVHSDAGGYLGTVEDAFVQETTGEITGYDVSGYLDESMKGKRYVPPPESFAVGEEAL